MKYIFKDYLKLNPFLQSPCSLPSFTYHSMKNIQNGAMFCLQEVWSIFSSALKGICSPWHTSRQRAQGLLQRIYLYSFGISWQNRLLPARLSHWSSQDHSFPHPPHHPVQSNRTQKITTALWLRSHHVYNGYTFLIISSKPNWRGKEK